MSEQNTFEKIYEVVKQIPKGKVATYGQVAALAGNRRWARVVGYALHANPNEQEIPCYRVVTKDGRVSKAFAFGGENRQMELLVADGVEFEDGHVVMEKYQWTESLGRKILEMYESVRPLEDREKEFLALCLAYPEKFWKTANLYSNSNKARIPEKSVEKLQTAIGQQAEKERFLENIFTFHL